MRLPRFFTKKRGHRRTDSHAWGSFAEGLFYALLVGAGVVFGLLLVTGTVTYALPTPTRSCSSGATNGGCGC